MDINILVSVKEISEISEISLLFKKQTKTAFLVFIHP